MPGLGLKRGLGDEVVVAPYATALAAAIDPARSADNLRRLADAGALGDYGFFDAIDYTQREGMATDAATGGVVVRAFFAHHEGMTLVALANAVFGDRMVERFHADPRVQATELLLQERVPRQRPTTEPRPLDEMRVSPPMPADAGPPLPDAPHGVSAYAVPIERQVRRERHQRRRGRERLPGRGGDSFQA